MFKPLRLKVTLWAELLLLIATITALPADAP